MIFKYYISVQGFESIDIRNSKFSKNHISSFENTEKISISNCKFMENIGNLTNWYNRIAAIYTKVTFTMIITFNVSKYKRDVMK